MKHKIKFFVLPAILVTILSGCGNDVLDWRNSEVSNGIIYLSGANKPFNGKVTNIPYSAVFSRQEGFNQLVGQGAAFMTALFGSSMLCDAEVSDGRLDGDITCKPPNKKEALIKGEFKESGLTGDFVMLDEKTLNVVTEAKFKDGQLNGTVKKYNPLDKKLVLEQNLKMGVEDGRLKRWNAEGNLIEDARFSNGKLDGAYLSRDGFGNTTKEGDYNEGVFTGKAYDYQYADGQAEPRFLIGKITSKFENDHVTNKNEVDDQREAIRKIYSCVLDLRSQNRAIDEAAEKSMSKGIAAYEADRRFVYLTECKKNPNAAIDNLLAKSPASSLHKTSAEDKNKPVTPGVPISVLPKDIEKQSEEIRKIKSKTGETTEQILARMNGKSAEGPTTACRNTDKPVFQCTTKSKKVVEVCDAGKTIKYSFGPAGKPELSLEVPRDQASTYQWNGMGSAISYSVSIPNGKTVYTVESVIDKTDETKTAGVNVEVDGKSIAKVQCATEPTVDNLEGIDLKSTE